MRSWAIRQMVAGGVVVGRRHVQNPEPIASRAKTALAAHNSSARSGCKRYAEPSDGPNEHVVFGQHEGSSTGVAVIRQVKTPATNSAVAITDVSTGTSHGCLTIENTVRRNPSCPKLCAPLAEVGGTADDDNAVRRSKDGLMKGARRGRR